MRHCRGGWYWPIYIVCKLLDVALDTGIDLYISPCYFSKLFFSIKFIFESGTRHQKYIEIIEVFTISTLALLINQIDFIAIEWFGWHLIISKIIATGTVFFLELFRMKQVYFLNYS